MSTNETIQLTPCRECGFCVAPGWEFCPDCGRRQRPPEHRSWWARLTNQPVPERTDNCLRQQEARIEAELQRIEADLVKFEGQRGQVEARLEEARRAGRNPAPLERSRRSLEAALAQCRRLRARYRAARHGLSLDREENALRLLFL